MISALTIGIRISTLPGVSWMAAEPVGGGQAGQRDPPVAVGRHRIDRHQDGHPESHRRQAKGCAKASPLATLRPSTVPGNRRRATSGKVCSNASAYPRASVPCGRPMPTLLENKKGRAQAGGHQRQPAVEQPRAGRQPPQPPGALVHKLTLPPPGIRHIHPQATTPHTPRGDTPRHPRMDAASGDTAARGDRYRSTASDALMMAGLARAWADFIRCLLEQKPGR